MTMKKTGLVLMGLALLSTPAWASDYSSMTTEEMAEIRGTLQSATEQERNTFREEWQKRVATMTPEQQKQYIGPGNKKGVGKGVGYGQGIGQGKGKGKGQGGGRGRGRMNNQN